MTNQVLDAEGGSEMPQVLEGLELGALDGLVAQARQRGLQLTGEGGLLQELTRRILESALEGEMTDHLGAGMHERVEEGPRENHRNGHRAKTVQTEIGPVEIQVPRDRAGSFEPQLVKKRQRRLGGIDEMVLSLSAKGLTHGEISAHLAEVYGASVSKQTISTITDSVLAGMVEWQNRPLDSGRFPSVVANYLVMGRVRNPLIASMGVLSPRTRRGRRLSASATARRSWAL
jgi:putative transposase